MIRFPFFKNRANSESRDISNIEQHDMERQQFREVLESIDATRISDRLRILDEFLSVELHITLPHLLEFIEAGGIHGYDLDFLRETMDMFVKCGFAQKNEFDSLETTYEHHHLGDHHDHFICTACGLIQEFHNSSLENLQLELAAEYNFHPLQHKTEIYGLCEDCLSCREKNPPLQLASVGEKVMIVEIQGGRELQARMAAMGLSPGTILEVINNNPAGPFIVAANDTRVALDSVMAQTILVAHSCRHPDKADQ